MLNTVIMKSLCFFAVSVVVLSVSACKGRDKCGDCPTFSKVEIDQDQNKEF